MKNIFDRVSLKMKKYPYGSQSESSDPLVVVKLFDSVWSAIWYLTEFDKENWVAFWYVEALVSDPWCDEWGSIGIDELAWLQFFGRPRVELDKFFEPKRFSEIWVRSK